MNELDKAYEEMGMINEKIYKPIIQEVYGSVSKTSYKYCRVDFVGKDYCGELKSRNLSINSFTETMIGYNKIKEGFKKLDLYKDQIPNYKVYLWFAFKEGLYSWELNKTNYELNGGDNQKRIGGTSNRGWKDYKDHYYIKKEFLTKVNNTPAWIHTIVEQNSNFKSSIIPKGVCLLKFKKG